MKRAIVVDLDGTLCNSGHREHLAVNKEWDQFHSALADDKPHGDVAWLIGVLSCACLSGEIEIIACTGRPEKYRAITERWLSGFGILFDEVLMRPDDDWLSDTVLKPQLVMEWHDRQEDAAHGTAQERVLFVLDDRDRVVEAWRGHGFNCWQVRLGGY
jgi:hypothetical protein